MRPKIGITCAHDNETDRLYLTQYYTRAVAKAGGLPLLLPPTPQEAVIREYMTCLDGLILSGGVDVDPVFFGEEPHIHGGEITPERDAFEIPLTRLWLAGGKPLLAICRGLQVLNIAAGGDIYQDLGEIPGMIKHMQQAPKWHGSHGVKLAPGSKLAGMMGCAELRVNSFHHQAVRRLAPGFRAAGTTADGIVEAVEADRPFAIGVQWHPECMWEEADIQLRLFQELVNAAKG